MQQNRKLVIILTHKCPFPKRLTGCNGGKKIDFDSQNCNFGAKMALCSCNINSIWGYFFTSEPHCRKTRFNARRITNESNTFEKWFFRCIVYIERYWEVFGPFWIKLPWFDCVWLLTNSQSVLIGCGCTKIFCWHLYTLFKENNLSNTWCTSFSNSLQVLKAIQFKFWIIENLDFDALTCSGDRFYGFFDKVEEIITEGSIFWVKTNKTIWEGRVIKIPFSYLPEDAKHLKLIWINTKRKIDFLLEIVTNNTNTKIFLHQLRETRIQGLWRNQCWILQIEWDIRNRDLNNQL